MPWEGLHVGATVNLRRDRTLFYVGLILLLLGGPGLLLGTFAHDILRVPVLGSQFEGFGWLNLIALTVGIALAAIGAALLALGLRGGVLSEPEVAELSKSGGSGT